MSMNETVWSFSYQWYKSFHNFNWPLRTCTQPRLLLSIGMAPCGAVVWLIFWSLSKRRVQFLSSYVRQKRSILLFGAKALHLLSCKKSNNNKDYPKSFFISICAESWSPLLPPIFSTYSVWENNKNLRFLSIM